MKGGSNMKRKIAIIMLSVILACMLSGCQSTLDDMKSRHAVFTENGDISYGGVLYKKLNYIDENIEYFNMDSAGEYVIVTDPEVPVLLSQRYGKYHSITSDKTFIYYMEYSYKTEGNEYEKVYCAEDKYDAVLLHIKEGYKPDGYCYTFYRYDEKYRPSIQTIDLTDAQIKVLEAIRAGEPVLNREYSDFEHMATIKSCTSDKLMAKAEYSVTVSDGKYYVVNNNSDGTETSFAVPDEYKDVVEQIMRPVIENDMITYDMYDE